VDHPILRVGLQVLVQEERLVGAMEVAHTDVRDPATQL
jgi:hypothetical protein